jgi:hypothetical protein
MEKQKFKESIFVRKDKYYLQMARTNLKTGSRIKLKQPAKILNG